MQEEVSNVARYLPQLAVSCGERVALRIPLVGFRQKFLATGADSGYLSLSYARLEALASGLSHAFAAHGITRGMRVLLMLRPGKDLILTIFALFKMGAVPVVIDPGMGLKAFRACVVRTRPQALVGIGLGHVIARLFRKDFGGIAIRIRLGGRMGPGGVFGEDRLEKLVSGQPTHFEPVATRRDELAAILFTSGSTGAPKGVCYEHGMFEAQVQLVREAYGIEPGEVDLPLLPVFALFGPALGFTSVVPQMNPGKPASVDPAALVRAIEDNAVTNSFGSPVLWTKIAAYCEARGKTLPTLRRVLMAGAPAHPTLLRRMAKLLPNGEVHTPYGATEVLPVSSIAAREILEQTAAFTRLGFGTCVGKPLPGVRVRIVAIDAEPHAACAAEAPQGVTASTGGDSAPGNAGESAGAIDAMPAALPAFDAVRILPVGQIGEIVVTGPSVTKAYDHLPEATAGAKIRDEADGTLWHRMGDTGAVDAQGRLWFCGRKAERVLIAAEAALCALRPPCGETATAGAGSGTRADDSSGDADGSGGGADGSGGGVFFGGGAFFGGMPAAESPAVAALRTQRVLYTDCVEGIMNAHPAVFRSALVGLGGRAYLLVEPWRWPRSAAAKAELKASLRTLADAHAITRTLVDFHFRKRFPVDVRHNAKIHRLTLTRELAAQLGVTVS